MEVVICFQIVSLTYWKTTKCKEGVVSYVLWFAFKLYLWRIEKQLIIKNRLHFVSCDLLSNCIFDVLKNNALAGKADLLLVVICFQIVSLTYWKTTGLIEKTIFEMLWFAFKLYLWRIEKQPDRQIQPYKISCDLLSNCIFDVLKNNIVNCCHNFFKVVICFQIVSLTYWKTTFYNPVALHCLLWFAFKLYLWRIEKQPSNLHCICICRCDLLSNCIFDVLKNNFQGHKGEKDFVVICFQIVSLTYWKTTWCCFRLNKRRLWFAFKLYLWRIEKQPLPLASFAFSCCDLLSNCIFDVLKNNE